MYKFILPIVLLFASQSSIFAQNLLVKQVADENAKYSAPELAMIDVSQELRLDTTNLFLMLGFDKPQNSKKNVSVYLKEDSINEMYYNQKLMKNGEGFGVAMQIKHFIDRPIELQLSGEDVRDTLYFKVGNDLSKLAFTNRNQEVVAKKDSTTQAPAKEVIQNPLQSEQDSNTVENTTTNSDEITEDGEEATGITSSDWITLLLVAVLLSSLLTFLITRTMLKRQQPKPVEKPQPPTISEKEKEKIQLNLLTFLSRQEAEGDYSAEVQKKVSGIKSALAEWKKLKIQASIKKKTTEPEDQPEPKPQTEEPMTTTNTTYPDYYISFHDELRAIFQNLSILREKINPSSTFTELLDKILKSPPAQSTHPLLQFALRDQFVLEKLKLASRADLKNIDAATFFDKFVYWQCGALINNLSKLYAYSNFDNSKLPLKQMLQDDNLDAALLNQTFQRLQQLLENTFNIHLNVPKLGDKEVNDQLSTRIDYNFIKSKFYDKLPELESGIIYDFNKVAIIKKSDNSVYQKSQVSVKQ